MRRAAASLRGLAARRGASSSAAATLDAFPSHPDELTPEWLTAALTHAGRIPQGATVRSFEREAMGASVGLASLVQRLTCAVAPPPDATSAPQPLSAVRAVAKFAPTDAAARAMADKLGSFRRECGFHAALAQPRATSPPRTRRSRSRTTTTDTSPAGVAHDVAPALPVASAFFARHNPDTGRAAVLMEDLSADGWLPGDQVVGAAPALAARVVADVARLHAAYWKDPRLDEWVAQGWLPRLDSDTVAGFDAAEFAASWPRWRRRFPEAAAALPGGWAATLDADPSAFQRFALNVALPRLASGPRTLLHGDLRLDNVMWRPGGSPADVAADVAALPAACRYIDLGDCAAGRGAFDVAYFMAMSLPTQLQGQARAAAVAQLVQLYRTTLAHHGVRRHVSRLESELSLATLYCLSLAVNLGGMEGLDAAPPRKRALAAAMAARIPVAMAAQGRPCHLKLLRARARRGKAAQQA